MNNTTTCAEINNFWFNETSPKLWFGKNAQFDALIRTRFLLSYNAAASGKFDDWQVEGLGCVALCVLLDQFPRNLFRNDRRAFATDAKALTVARTAIEKSLDLEPTFEDKHRHFLYTPFMHSEEIADQRLCLMLLTERMDNANAVDYSKRHLAIIERFGRFPHRNAVLGREDTTEEAEFLKQANSRF